MITGALRVALYAEGAGETSDTAVGVTPGEPLGSAHRGPGHILISRLISHSSPVAPPVVQFLRPLRLPMREARGSDLTTTRVLRRLLNSPQKHRAPDCSIVLLDDDGDPDKVKDAITEAQTAFPPACVVVASRTFEAWLIADHDGLQAALQATFAMSSAPDTVDAKTLLAGFTATSMQARPGMTAAMLRRSIAEQMDLDRARSRSPSFDRAAQTLASFVSAL